MISQTQYKQAFLEAPSTPFVPEKTYSRMIVASSAVVATSISIFSLKWKNPYVTAGLTLLSFFHMAKDGPKVFTDWIPKLASMVKREIVRKITGRPNVNEGLNGWREVSDDNPHFDRILAKAVIALALTYGAKSIADFSLGGKGEYRWSYLSEGFFEHNSVVVYDFSQASVARGFIEHATLNQDPYQWQFHVVTSFGVLSQTKPGEHGEPGEEAEALVRKLVEATRPGGRIVISCATPDQSGLYSNPLPNETVIKLFAANNCVYQESDSWKLRHLHSPSHPEFDSTIMVFKKPKEVNEH